MKLNVNELQSLMEGQAQPQPNRSLIRVQLSCQSSYKKFKTHSIPIPRYPIAKKATLNK